MDYGSYRFRRKEELWCILVSIILSSVAAWILYKSILGLIVILIIYPFYRSIYRKKCIKMQQNVLIVQFKDMILSVSAAMLSGYAIENAWREAEKEICELYGESSYMAMELKNMNTAIRMNQPVEQLLYEFALRSRCEDIMNFSEVFRFAKRSGGNFGKILYGVAMRISEKQEIEQEIQTVIAGKRMEQTVMNVIPIGILGYLNVTSSEFMQPLYGNLFGVVVMTGAFLTYLGAVLLSRKMMEIKY